MPSGNNNGGKKKDEPPRELKVDNLVSIAKSVKARISAESKRTREMETSRSDEREEASATPSTASSEDSSGSLRSPASASTSALEPDRRQLSAFRRDSRDHPETAAQTVQKQKERRDVERRVWEKRIAEFEVDMHYVNREIESISALKTAAGSDKEKLARLDERFAELESKSKCLIDDIEIYTRRLAEYPEL